MGEGVLAGEIQERVPESRNPTRDDVKGSAWVAVAVQDVKPREPPCACVVWERPHWSVVFDAAGETALVKCGNLARGRATLNFGKCRDPRCGREHAFLDVDEGGEVHGQPCGDALVKAGCHRLEPCIITENMRASGLEEGDLMLTARTESVDLAAALEAGANDYMTKPFDSQELKARIAVGQRLISSVQCKWQLSGRHVSHLSD